MTITAVEALELGQVLGSLLESIVRAQAESARATVDFVDSIGFEDEQMRTVKLRFSKKDEDGIPADFEVEVPLLALVNVPSLAVKQAKLTFAYDIVTATSLEPPPVRPALPVRLAPATLTGFVRAPMTTAAQPSRRTTSIDLEVTLEQQEMPIGIERLFDLAELGIHERPSSTPPQ